MTDTEQAVFDIADRFRRYVADSAELLARDLAALLNRAGKLNIAVVPDVDREGVSYGLEWASGSVASYLGIEWDTEAKEWKVADESDLPETGLIHCGQLNPSTRALIAAATGPQPNVIEVRPEYDEGAWA